MTRRVVVSAVNLVEGGSLTVLRDCLKIASELLPPDWEIIALVNRKSLIDEPRVQTIEFPEAKRSYLRRIYLEWYGFLGLSRELKPDLWLSLQDITPRVDAKRQAVYCHNPGPLYRITTQDIIREPALLLFGRFYHFVYKAFIRRNYFVIVQQEWIRQLFIEEFKAKKVLVSYPVEKESDKNMPVALEVSSRRPVVFLYPALARVLKNFETLLDAAVALSERYDGQFELRLTISAEENSHAEHLVKKYAACKSIKFIGRVDPETMGAEYQRAEVMVFPSRAETWGLPITESQTYGLKMLVADLPYAHETVGAYENVRFLPVEDVDAWTRAMSDVIEGAWRPDPIQPPVPAEPFARGWDQTWSKLIDGL